MLLDERTRAIANRIEEALAVLPRGLAQHAAGHSRQRRIAAHDGLDGLASALVEQFAAARPVVAA